MPEVAGPVLNGTSYTNGTTKENGHMSSDEESSSNYFNLSYNNPDFVSHYDDWAHKYDEEVASEGYEGPKSMLETTAKFIPKSARILELGAGSGLVGILLKNHGYHNVDALEPSEGMLTIAKQRGAYQKHFLDMLSENEPCSVPDNAYDALVCLGCFIPNHLNTGHLKEIIRMVRVNGRIILGINQLFIRPSYDPEEYFPYDLTAAIDTLEKSGKIKIVDRQIKPYLSKRTDGVFLVIQKQR